MTPRPFKCSQFRKGTLDFNFECINLFQNDFCKQRYITLNVTIQNLPENPSVQNFFAEYILLPFVQQRDWDTSSDNVSYSRLSKTTAENGCFEEVALAFVI